MVLPVFFRPDAPRIEPDAVTEAVSNAHDRQILAMAQTGDVSAQEIVDGTQIPQSTVYRRLNRLEEHGLVVVERGTIRKGNPTELYRARVELAGVRVEAGSVDAEWRLRESPDERLHRLWGMMREGHDD